MMPAGLFRNHNWSRVWIGSAGRSFLPSSVNSQHIGRDFQRLESLIASTSCESIVVLWLLIFNNSQWLPLWSCGCEWLLLRHSTFETSSVSCQSGSRAVVGSMMFWSTRGWAVAWLCCGNWLMNDVEVGIGSWWFVFRSSPLYLCDLARTQVGFRFSCDSISLFTFRSHIFSLLDWSYLACLDDFRLILSL